MFDIIPSPFTALRERYAYEHQRFPTILAKKISQIAYDYRKQTSLNEQQLLTEREKVYIELVSKDLIFGKIKSLGFKSVLYKFALPNSIGLPVVGHSSNIDDMVPPIANILGITQNAARNKINGIYITRLGLNTVLLKDKNQNAVSIYIFKTTV